MLQAVADGLGQIDYPVNRLSGRSRNGAINAGKAIQAWL
jgi:hypothetical protein